jgi:rhodanese-related sulfurtransferase
MAKNNITEERNSVTININGKEHIIKRVEGRDVYLTNEFSLTSRPSPPFYIQPFKVADGIETYGELEVINFLEKNRGIFIDARLKSWFKKSYIPGAINIPFKVFLTDNSKRDKALTKLGAKKSKKGWDFSKVKSILLYCNGAWCGQSPAAIKALIKIGFPKEKMKYYRGGIQSWQLVGLTVDMPNEEK